MQFIDEVKGYLNSFGTYMSTIQWQDYVEILLIALLLYYMMKWMHRTRAWSLMRGLFVILLFLILANLFHMDTILWMASNIIQFAVIALIVVFAPELRRALETLGSRSILGNIFYFGDTAKDRTLEWNAINEIVKACSQMGKARTGALIVIERTESLNRIDETGIKVDAEITSQLLINIFEKNTPLHDGAVTIRNNRVSSATCYLPLTQSRLISKELGTRHRAGLGMSEESDAMVIVVSEETGRIAVARDGQLERNLTDEALKQLLISAVGIPEGGEEAAGGKKRRRRKA